MEYHVLRHLKIEEIDKLVHDTYHELVEFKASSKPKLQSITLKFANRLKENEPEFVEYYYSGGDMDEFNKLFHDILEVLS